MDSPFMTAIADGLGVAGIRVVRFEFPYMRTMRSGGARRPPDPPQVLIQAWRTVLADVGHASDVVIGGKSMGGRIASVVADEAGVRGLVCLGFPFHAPGKAAGRRVEHLETVRTPMLILQGERDPFGSRAEVEGYTFSPAVRVVFVPDGDHSFRPRGARSTTEAENLRLAVGETARFVTSIYAGQTGPSES